MTKTRAAWGWRVPVLVLSEALACRPGCVWSSYHARHRSWHGQSVWLGWSRRPSGDCGLEGERWSNPEAHPHMPHHPPTTSPSPPLLSPPLPRARLWEQVDPKPALLLGGWWGGRQWAVSSPLFISTGAPPTGAASLFLYIVIKYRLSAQPLPEAKGKSLC